jgi:hypothetical protein
MLQLSENITLFAVHGQMCIHSRIFQHFKELEGSLLISQGPFNSHYLRQTNPVHTTLYAFLKIHLNIVQSPKSLFTVVSFLPLTTYIYIYIYIRTFLVSPFHFACPSNFILIGLIILIIMGVA